MFVCALCPKIVVGGRFVNVCPILDGLNNLGNARIGESWLFATDHSAVGRPSYY